MRRRFDPYLEKKMREAFKAGFWAWAGPANEWELNETVKDEQEAWDKWRADQQGGK